MSKPHPRQLGVDEKAEERDRALGHYFVPERVKRVANGTIPEFDIDPCAHPSQLIAAKKKVVGSLIAGVDGFTQPWLGSCWLNPPNFKALKKDVVANYQFYPFAKWLERGLQHYDAGLLSTLMIYSPARNGVTWYNDMLRRCALHLVFDQRVNCLIGQRNSEGEDMPPREMTSPFGGSSLFLFTRDIEVGNRFIKLGLAEGVIQSPYSGPA